MIITRFILMLAALVNAVLRRIFRLGFPVLPDESGWRRRLSIATSIAMIAGAASCKKKDAMPTCYSQAAPKREPIPRSCYSQAAAPGVRNPADTGRFSGRIRAMWTALDAGKSKDFETALEEITKGGKLTDTEAKELAGIFGNVAKHRARLNSLVTCYDMTEAGGRRMSTLESVSTQIDALRNAKAAGKIPPAEVAKIAATLARDIDRFKLAEEALRSDPKSRNGVIEKPASQDTEPSKESTALANLVLELEQIADPAPAREPGKPAHE